MPKLIDLTGKRFGRLIVIERCENKHKAPYWKCKCDCGNVCVIQGRKLRDGITKSCGCLHKEISKINHLTHGKSKHPLYSVWKGMKSRCNNKHIKCYKYYGEKGVSLCEDWNDFATFFDWSINNGYKHGLTIDRIDNNGNYCPENCRWVSIDIQQKNKSNCFYITYNGITMTASEWERATGVCRKTIIYRILHGATVKQALSKNKYIQISK